MFRAYFLSLLLSSLSSVRNPSKEGKPILEEGSNSNNQSPAGSPRHRSNSNPANASPKLQPTSGSPPKHDTASQLNLTDKTDKDSKQQGSTSDSGSGEKTDDPNKRSPKKRAHALIARAAVFSSVQHTEPLDSPDKSNRKPKVTTSAPNYSISAFGKPNSNSHSGSSSGSGSGSEKGAER